MKFRNGVIMFTAAALVLQASGASDIEMSKATDASIPTEFAYEFNYQDITRSTPNHTAIFQLKELGLLDLGANYQPNSPVSYGHLAYLLATSNFDFGGLTEDEATSFEENFHVYQESVDKLIAEGIFSDSLPLDEEVTHEGLASILQGAFNLSVADSTSPLEMFESIGVTVGEKDEIVERHNVADYLYQAFLHTAKSDGNEEESGTDSVNEERETATDAETEDAVKAENEEGTVEEVAEEVKPVETKVASAINRSFKDLPKNHWAHSVVQNAVKKGYLYGYADGTFRPSANVTRAEMAAILSRLSDTSDRSTVTFSDVSSTHWAHDAISESIALGLIKPSDYANGKFDPNKIMTRQEITNWIANFLISNNPEYDKVRVALGTSNLTLLPIAEFTKGTFPKAHVGRTGIVIGTGIMGGYIDGTFKPTGNTNRAEIASIIFRLEAAMKKSPTEFKHLNELVEVAKTGTNMLSIGMKQKNEGRDFSSLRQEKHALLNGNGHVRINRLILLDARDRNKLPDSVYAAMFKDTVREALARNDNYGQQIAVVEHAFKPTKTTPNAQWYGYGRTSHAIVKATDLGPKTYKDYGLKRATDYFSGWQFDAQGEQKMWYMSTTVMTQKRNQLNIRDTVDGRGYWWSTH